VNPALTRIVSWGHEFLAENIKKGQLAVDLTAGNGYDTLMLYRRVGETGQVIAFDIQTAALASTQQRLAENGVVVRRWSAETRPIPQAAGVDLIHAGHQDLAHFLPAKVHGVVANLGYFHGGDQTLVTQPQTTVAALDQATECLASGGRLVVVVYTGHPGGRAEGEAVDGFFTSLEEQKFQVLQMKVLNRPEAPYLLVAEKRA
jgi:16S rRNA G1207 methylase RsmC